MKVECTLCDKVYNFKKEKIPTYGFSFPCKSCGEKIKVSQAEIDAFLAGAKKGTAKKKIKVALPKVETEKLKKQMVKAGDKDIAYDWGIPRFDRQHYEGYPISLEYLMHAVEEDRKGTDLLASVE